MPSNPPNSDDVLTLIDQRSPLAVVELVSAGDPSKALAAIRSAVVTLYWTRKDLPRVVTVSVAAMSVGLAKVGSLKDASALNALLSEVKGLAYNLGSFTWLGWGEAGIAPGATDIAIGLEAARLNLNLAIDLRKGDLPVAQAYWLLGAQSIAAGRLDDALRYFDESASYAFKAEAPNEVALARAFAGLTGAAAVDATDDKRDIRRQQIRSAIALLIDSPNGAAFINQIRTAATVFGWEGNLPVE